MPAAALNLRRISRIKVDWVINKSDVDCKITVETESAFSMCEHSLTRYDRVDTTVAVEIGVNGRWQQF
jgi:hypothetical protein